MLTTLAVAGYRSLRDVVVPLAPLTVVTGPNGAGKSNLYNAIRLLAQVGRGALIGAVAREGGLSSLLWAGPERGGSQGTVRKRPVAVLLGFASDDLGYLVDLGLPQVDQAERVQARSGDQAGAGLHGSGRQPRVIAQAMTPDSRPDP